jgi:hypothetical protein
LTTALQVRCRARLVVAVVAVLAVSQTVRVWSRFTIRSRGVPHPLAVNPRALIRAVTWTLIAATFAGALAAVTVRGVAGPPRRPDIEDDWLDRLRCASQRNVDSRKVDLYAVWRRPPPRPAPRSAPGWMPIATPPRSSKMTVTVTRWLTSCCTMSGST